MENEITYKRMRIVIVAMCLVTLVLFGVKLYIETALSVHGDELSRLQNQIKVINQENMVLEEKIYAAESYTTLAQEAKNMGFVPTTDKTYIYLQ